MPDPIVMLAAIGAFVTHPAAVALGANAATALIQGLVRHFDKNNVDRKALRRELADAGAQVTDELLNALADATVEFFDASRDRQRLAADVTDLHERIVKLQNTIGADRQAADTAFNMMTRVAQDMMIAFADQENLKDQLAEIRTLFYGQLTVTRGFIVIRDADTPEGKLLLRDAMDLHPENVFLDRLVPRPQVVGQAQSDKNILVTGLPGGGKTTTMYQILLAEEAHTVVVIQPGFGAVPDHIRYLEREDLPDRFDLVYDNIQESPRTFYDKMLNLRTRFPGLRLLCACRKPNMPWVQTQAIPGFRETLKLDEIELPPLSRDEAEGVVSICEEYWHITVDPQVRNWLLDRVSDSKDGGKTKTDGTPFYVISLLAPIRAEDDATVHLADIVGLPRDTLGIWQAYFGQLLESDRDEDISLLRAIKIMHELDLPAERRLVYTIAREVFSIADEAVLDDAAHRLQTRLWTTLKNDRFDCYDVQFEAVPIPEHAYDRLEQWIIDLPPDDLRKLLFIARAGIMRHNHTTRASSSEALRTALQSQLSLWYSGIEACMAEEDSPDRALFLNNASNCYSALASAAPNDDERRERLKQAVDAIEKAVDLYRKLNLPADLAMSLNNASNCYSSLASAAPNDDDRRERLKRAVDAIEEAIRIRRKLNLPADLAGSLNNVSNRYSDLASAAPNDDERRERLKQAVDAIEEAIRIRRKLNLPADLASSLNNAAICYSSLASSAPNDDERRERLNQALEGIEEAVDLYRKLNLPADLAGSLNNASTCYSSLASAAPNDDERRERLKQAVDAIEEAVDLHRKLNLPADLAASLNNASIPYSALASSARDDDERRERLNQAVDAIEKAVDLYRKLNLPADLAMSLNNASEHYSALASSARDDDERRERLNQAVDAIEKAVDLYRKLNLPADLAMSLNNASGCYSSLASSAPDDDERRKRLKQAVDAIEEAVDLYRKLDLPANLAMSLATSANVHHALADDDEEKAPVHLQESAASIDEAIALFEAIGRHHWLTQAYPDGVRHHFPLASDHPESLAKLTEYAAKAADVLQRFGRSEEGAHFAELARKHANPDAD